MDDDEKMNDNHDHLFTTKTIFYIQNFIIYLYRSIYRSSFNDFSLSTSLNRFSSGVGPRDKRFSGVALRLCGTRPLSLFAGAAICDGKGPDGKPGIGGVPAL